MATLALGTLIKLALGGVSGATAITPVVFYIAPPWAVELTKEKLEEFKSSKGFESCQTFISASDNKHLLFLCVKGAKETDQNKTAHFYFYNGGSWEEAISLEKDSENKSKNFFLVRTRTWWGEGRRVINSLGEITPSTLTEHDKHGMRCNFSPSVLKKGSGVGKHFVCFENSTSGGKNHQLKWTLKDFEPTKQT